MDVRPHDGSRPPVPDHHAHAAQVARPRSEVDHLHRALASRAVIAQATAIRAERTRSELRLVAADLAPERGGVVGPDLLAEDDAPEPAGGG